MIQQTMIHGRVMYYDPESGKIYGSQPGILPDIKDPTYTEVNPAILTANDWKRLGFSGTLLGNPLYANTDGTFSVYGKPGYAFGLKGTTYYSNLGAKDAKWDAEKGVWTRDGFNYVNNSWVPNDAKSDDVTENSSAGEGNGKSDSSTNPYKGYFTANGLADFQNQNTRKQWVAQNADWLAQNNFKHYDFSSEANQRLVQLIKKWKQEQAAASGNGSSSAATNDRTAVENILLRQADEEEAAAKEAADRKATEDILIQQAEEEEATNAAAEQRKAEEARAAQEAAMLAQYKAGNVYAKGATPDWNTVISANSKYNMDRDLNNAIDRNNQAYRTSRSALRDARRAGTIDWNDYWAGKRNLRLARNEANAGIKAWGKEQQEGYNTAKKQAQTAAVQAIVNGTQFQKFGGTLNYFNYLDI